MQLPCLKQQWFFRSHCWNHSYDNSK